MAYRRIPLKPIRLPKEIHRNAFCRVKHGKLLRRTVRVWIGVRPDCVLSSLLFNKVRDTILGRALDNSRRIVWGLQGRLNDLDYADDICLLAQSLSDIAANLRSVALAAESACLKINVLKTKLYIWTKPPGIYFYLVQAK